MICLIHYMLLCYINVILQYVTLQSHYNSLFYTMLQNVTLLYIMLCCAVLCCAVLCCATLRWAGLGCAALCCAVLSGAVLHCAALGWVVLCHAMLCSLYIIYIPTYQAMFQANMVVGCLGNLNGFFQCRQCFLSAKQREVDILQSILKWKECCQPK